MLSHPDEAAPERPWTPSYSVIRQGSTPALSTKELEAETSEVPPTDIAEAAAAETPEVVVVAPTPAPAAETGPILEQPVVAATTEPVERPWTPSYSVSHQGTPPPTAVEEAPIETPVAVIVSPEPEEPTVVEESPAVKPEDVPERPWTPSYSVINQGSSPRVSPKELEEVPTVVEPEVLATSNIEPPRDIPERPWTPSYSVSQQGQSPVIPPKAEEEEVHADVAAELSPTAAPEEALPERPWTPSYTVTKQGTTPQVAPKELEQPTPVAPKPVLAVLVEPVSADTLLADAPPERPWTPSYSVTKQGTSPVVVATEVAEPEPTAEVPEVPPTWTPSYSVSRQGTSPMIGATELPVVDVEVAPADKPETSTPEIAVHAEEPAHAEAVKTVEAAVSVWSVFWDSFRGLMVPGCRGSC